MKKSTISIHGRKDRSFRAANYPIYQTTTFAVEKSDDYKKFVNDSDDFYIYTRYSNPTVRAVEEKLASLEFAEDAVLFASGMAAIATSIMSLVAQGETIAAMNRLYGMTYRFLRDVVPRYGINVVFLKESELYNLKETAPHAKLVYFETPINPTTECISISRVVNSAKQIGALTIVDNSFASPINQNPINFGVDIVIHSATKYIGGHSDVMAGVSISSKGNIRIIREAMKAFGGCINPLDAFLLDRSLKTLKVRVEEQNRIAEKLAQFFLSTKKVRRVYYPGIIDTDTHKIASEQMSGYGGMLCIDLGSLEKAKKFCDSLKLSLNATSLGGVETLVSIPVLTSHIKMSRSELTTAGVSPGMVRISAGLEDPDDLIDDFKAALRKI
ncbi:MAG: trans-sulfuration enzyme family protein [Candidatus Kryptoniota bacterium]